jgi:hypothetical protein
MSLLKRKSAPPAPRSSGEARHTSGTFGPIQQARTCPHMQGCEMYGLFSLAGTLETWKLNYCTADHDRCERYVRALEGRPVLFLTPIPPCTVR